MLTWRRTRVALPCGSCRASIPAGGILLEIANAAGRRARCVACGTTIADGPPPDDLPALEELLEPVPSLLAPGRRRSGHGFVSSRTFAHKAKSAGVAAVLDDFKRRQSGEDDL